MKLPSPNDHIIETSTKNATITISKLHPYAHYSASVTAFNSHYGGESREITFQTNESGIYAYIYH